MEESDLRGIPVTFMPVGPSQAAPDTTLEGLDALLL